MFFPLLTLALCLYLLNWLLQRALVAMMLLLVLLLGSGCMVQLPETNPPVRLCWPPLNWMCAPGIEWGIM